MSIIWISIIDNVGLDTVVVPPVPNNIRLDSSSTPTVINITWDMVEGISPTIVTYEVTYSLRRRNGSSENDRVSTVSLSIV